MGWEAWLVVFVVGFMVYGLAREWAAPGLLVLGCVMVLVLAGVIFGSTKLPTARECMAEFGNPALVTVAALFIVVAGLMQTGAMTLITEPMLGRPTTVLGAQLRLLIPVTLSSAFLNNTPIVAMFMPVTDDMCKKANLSPSKLFMPMAFAATFGGVCTMIGTSTNLVVAGMLVKAKMPNGDPYPALQLLDISWVGIPCAIGGVVFMMLFSRWLLPDRKPPISLSDDPQKYTVEMLVQPGGPLVGKSIEQAGLRHLPGLFLMEIERNGEILPAVSSHEHLQEGDRLVFAGVVESVVDLRRVRGLIPASDQVFKLDAPVTNRCLVEAVVSPRCPLVGITIREGRFRTRYNAAVIAVARAGHRITGKIGDIVLQAGDTLLMEAHDDFSIQQRNSTDFYLVSHVENSTPVRHDRAWLALLILAAMIAAATIWEKRCDMLTASLAAAMAMVLTRCCTGREARDSVEWQVLTVIGGSFGIGIAIERSGAAAAIASQMIGWSGSNPWVMLGMIYFITLLLTELVTNNAAAALMFPLTMKIVQEQHLNHMPFVMAIMVAASCGFATPFGYQTNLMVYGPGGYRFSDYLRMGIPLDLLMMAICVILAPFIWPF